MANDQSVIIPQLCQKPPIYVECEDGIAKVDLGLQLQNREWTHLGFPEPGIYFMLLSDHYEIKFSKDNKIDVQILITNKNGDQLVSIGDEEYAYVMDNSNLVLVKGWTFSVKRRDLMFFRTSFGLGAFKHTQMRIYNLTTGVDFRSEILRTRSMILCAHISFKVDYNREESDIYYQQHKHLELPDLLKKVDLPTFLPIHVSQRLEGLYEIGLNFKKKNDTEQ